MRIKKIYCIKCNKHRKFKKSIFDQTLVPSIICDKCGSKDKTISKEQ